ncbi:PepSY-associated TM helix domain-containing protein [Desulfosediminicola flagellatus]|uniref:PepSY-associated TM helix domain-containing protein n=1 Tax=Desulfosediminicola flagellatus TaxID=2569541 RepID=UPI0010ACD18C|nr:PepSY-associated TM helix domain-containing protein [Desulfosediminicola flagellatus]
MKWRRWNNILHRDLGYLCFGLTIIYAISGIAVNHIADWNPNYRIERIQSTINTEPLQGLTGDKLIHAVLSQIDETGKIKGSYQQDDTNLQIFVVNNNVTANLKTGAVFQEKNQPRKVLYEMNFLHINHAKKLWTWVADIYAISLALLSITGLFVLRGQKGITGRGKWLTGIGFLIPIFFLWLYL